MVPQNSFTLSISHARTFPLSDVVAHFAEVLKSGGLVAFPTETVYGLGASAWNRSAIASVFMRKGRPSDNPLIVHIAEPEHLRQFAIEFTSDAQRLTEAFWPGPLTVILKRRPEVLDIITGGLDTVALRMPNHAIALDLISKAGPLVAPSANTSGKPSPTKADHVKEDFGSDFPLLDGGATQIGLESTVISLVEEPYRIYRPGAISASDVEQVIGRPIASYKPSENVEKPPSPGMKYSHYAPKAKVSWMEPGEAPSLPSTLYLRWGPSAVPLTTGDHRGPKPAISATIVDYGQNFQLMAAELYDRFRMADHAGFTQIKIEPLPDMGGIVEALKNRIQRAIG